jgi:hypothetical protein
MGVQKIKSEGECQIPLSHPEDFYFILIEMWVPGYSSVVEPVLSKSLDLIH